MYYMYNIYEKIKKKADYVPVTESVRQGLIKEYKDKLNNSPIVNITWKLKYNEGIQRSQANFTVKPINYFYNTKFYGAVSLVLKGRLLIVNIIRHDFSTSFAQLASVYYVYLWLLYVFL